MSIGKTLYIKFLNSGERYDPSIAKMMKLSEFSHVKRYEFAKQFINKENTVLDIACGTGYGSKIISSNCKYIIGVDISNEAIQYAINKYKSRNAEFFIGDFFENKFTKDIVVSFETIEHISNHSINEILDQLISYCKYILIGSVPFKEVEGNNPYHYFFNFFSFVFLR
jgi:2-polyprenyl-3-methyl-5-hydroxy-6-metoxy-1,4-benzoquinol methylase